MLTNCIPVRICINISRAQKGKKGRGDENKDVIRKKEKLSTFPLCITLLLYNLNSFFNIKKFKQNKKGGGESNVLRGLAQGWIRTTRKQAWLKRALTQDGRHGDLQAASEVDRGIVQPQEATQPAFRASALHGSAEADRNGGDQGAEHLDQQDNHDLVGVLENL